MPEHQAPHAKDCSESQFYQRLRTLASESDSTSLANLLNATKRLLESADAISKQIVRFLPQFTLHDNTHLWNVLSFMEELAGGNDAIQGLEAGDCAMAIWAAFIHDLGMVLEAEELAALDAVDEYDASVEPSKKSPSEKAEAWRAYRDGHEHWATIRQAPNDKRNRMRLGIIRAAFIRDSHARDDAHSGQCRIDDWLNFLADGDRLLAQALEDYAISDRIVRVAVSHNQDIGWLPRQLTQMDIDKPHAEALGAGLGTVHWTWISWLLRLADVFDCDKSRTPKVLFDHGGITDARSKAEWQKHLAIREAPLWEAGADGQTLLYTCHTCPNPIVEKAIHQIIGWMNDEIEKVQAASYAISDHASQPELRLPSQARVDIKRREGGYLYHDMEFRLDRDAVVELLMGESLYGGPELALRELVQNALDAVHLRDQRNRLAMALNAAGGAEKPRHPHQSWDGQPAEVIVSWGEEGGRRYVRVQDSGVGMTVGTMRRFLTQIGKSYYKSDDFRAEQELMRRNGILCTAISQFGIGFLSVFMLADEVTIYTRPVGVAVEKPPADGALQETARFPFRAEIHGPHGLLAFYPDKTATLPGTTVTIWLKDNFVLPDWNRDVLIARLRQEFYNRELPREVKGVLEKQNQVISAPQQVLDPGFEISRFIVWPLYPVKLSADAQSDPLIIDDSFHYRELVPLDREALKAKAEEWEHEIPEIEDTDWRVCDWTDESVAHDGVEGTGSRIRLIGPHPESRSDSLKPAEWTSLSEYLPSGQPRLLLGSFAEPQLPEPLTRYQCLVNGVRIVPGFVPSRSERDCKLPQVIEQLPVLPGEGGWVWIDLRGAAMPRLRADRSAPITTQSEPPDWRGLMQRWNASHSGSTPNWLMNQLLWIQCECPQRTTASRPIRVGLRKISPFLIARLLLSRSAILRSVNHFMVGDPSQYVALKFQRAVAHALARARDSAVARAFVRGHDAALDFALDRNLTRAPTHAQTLGFAHSLGLTLALDSVLRFDPGFPLNPDRAQDFFRSQLEWRGVVVRTGVESHLASEAIGTDRDESLPVTGLIGVGSRTDLRLVGPVRVTNSQNVVAQPDWLRAYDLVLPYTAFPLDALRSRFPEWTATLKPRLIYMLPFLCGQEPFGSLRESLKMNSPVESLMLFLPNPDHWEWMFVDHSREEWADGSASALWDLKTGKVLYADGIHTATSIRRKGVGKPLRDWLQQ
ncbi:chaperone protein HtpG [Novipirellula caenicola]|uniref:Chaperone protein HtpG n=2 Tax=Novipirellula caenicola TaxID=1536901 RepID=A0ABP9VMX9_9BACT